MTSAPSVTILPQIDIKCLQLLNQPGVGYFGAIFGEEGIDRCKPDFNASLERHGAVVYSKEIVSMSYAIT